MKALENCCNLFGKLDSKIEKRIKNYLDDPTFDTWDDICGIIIDSHFNTIWNAIIKLDPTFPREGRTDNIEGNIIKEWERIPTPLQVLQAIKEYNS
jgi:hypothetical protein